MAAIVDFALAGDLPKNRYSLERLQKAFDGTHTIKAGIDFVNGELVEMPERKVKITFNIEELD